MAHGPIVFVGLAEIGTFYRDFILQHSETGCEASTSVRIEYNRFLLNVKNYYGIQSSIYLENVHSASVLS